MHNFHEKCYNPNSVKNGLFCSLESDFLCVCTQMYMNYCSGSTKEAINYDNNYYGVHLLLSMIALQSVACLRTLHLTLNKA